MGGPPRLCLPDIIHVINSPKPPPRFLHTATGQWEGLGTRLVLFHNRAYL